MRGKHALVAMAGGVVIALTVAGGGWASQPSSRKATELKIGFSAALSGPYAAYDAPLLNGMKFAAKEINAKGGLGGFTIKIVSKDNKGDQTQTATTTQELLDQGIKVFVVTTGDTAVAGGQLAVQGGAIASVGGNTAPEIVKSIGKRGFMIVFGDNVQASAGAQYSCQSGYRKAYVIGSPEIPYTKFIPRYYEDAFKHDCGGKVTSKDTYKIGSTDFGTQVTKIQNAKPKPDVIYTSMFVPDFGVFMKQLRSAGVKTPVVTVDGNDSSLLVDSAGSAVDGVVYTTSAYPVKNNLDSQFVKAYKKQTGKNVESNTLEAIGRDNVYVIARAAALAKSTEPDKILAAVNKFKHYKLATGDLTMDPVNQVPTKEVFLVKMKGKKFTFLTSFTPKYIAKA
ncbi:MAG: branched-chain amino acid transport system substrate-binding protein [Gaiellales bacterium]|nr:branched-chain amino acid transport system substrate-binding protein [Gaiellales bacterium]